MLIQYQKKKYTENIKKHNKHETVLGEIEKEIPSGGLGRDIKIADSVKPSLFINFSRSYNSYFNIITPSIFFNDVDGDKNHIYFDEKFWKPFITFHPFLVIGKPYTLQTLKEFGFKTFSPFIDESYDTELDYFVRRDKIQREILRLCSMSISELDDWYWNMKLKGNEKFKPVFGGILLNPTITHLLLSRHCLDIL